MHGLLLLGTSYRTLAPSRLAAVSDAAALLARLLALQSSGAIRGGVALATCNRVELIVDADLGADDLRDTLLPGLPPAAVHGLAGPQAVHYLLRVAVGLTSMVAGEDQILAQTRRSFRDAEQHGLLSPALQRLRGSLVQATRDVRRRSGLERLRNSVPGLVARRASEVGPRLAVVGAGETGRRALEVLAQRGVRDVLVVNRDAGRAERVARHFGFRAVPLDRFLADPPVRDATIVALKCRAPLLGAGHLARLGRIYDISLPSAVDPEARAADADVVDLDRLAAIAEAENARHADVVHRAEELARARASTLAAPAAGGGRAFGAVIDHHVRGALDELEAAFGGALRHLDGGDRSRVRALVLRAARRNAHLHVQDLRGALEAS